MLDVLVGCKMTALIAGGEVDSSLTSALEQPPVTLSLGANKGDARCSDLTLLLLLRFSPAARTTNNVPYRKPRRDQRGES